MSALWVKARISLVVIGVPSAPLVMDESGERLGLNSGLVSNADFFLKFFSGPGL
jgi:hypothetical protein